MKMYILIKDSVPDNFAPLISAHASLACFRKFENEPDMQTWINGIFKKVICRVSDSEFENSKKESNNLILTESAINNEEVAIVFCPREEYSKQFKFFKMWKPK